MDELIEAETSLVHRRLAKQEDALGHRREKCAAEIRRQLFPQLIEIAVVFLNLHKPTNARQTLRR